MGHGVTHYARSTVTSVTRRGGSGSGESPFPLDRPASKVLAILGAYGTDSHRPFASLRGHSLLLRSLPTVGPFGTRMTSGERDQRDRRRGGYWWWRAGTRRSLAISAPVVSLSHSVRHHHDRSEGRRHEVKGVMGETNQTVWRKRRRETNIWCEMVWFVSLLLRRWSSSPRYTRLVRPLRGVVRGVRRIIQEDCYQKHDSLAQVLTVSRVLTIIILAYFRSLCGHSVRTRLTRLSSLFFVPLREPNRRWGVSNGGEAARSVTRCSHVIPHHFSSPRSFATLSRFSMPTPLFVRLGWVT